MKITDITAIYPKHPQKLGGWRPRLWQIVVRVETDVGVVGLGYGGGGEASLPIINGHFRELILNRTVENRRGHCRHLERSLFRINPLWAARRRHHGPQRRRFGPVGCPGQSGEDARCPPHQPTNRSTRAQQNPRVRIWLGCPVASRTGLHGAQIGDRCHRQVQRLCRHHRMGGGRAGVLWCRWAAHGRLLHGVGCGDDASNGGATGCVQSLLARRRADARPSGRTGGTTRRDQTHSCWRAANTNSPITASPKLPWPMRLTSGNLT